jgi:tetratricopeptide (TPR) repeat protein
MKMEWRLTFMNKKWEQLSRKNKTITLILTASVVIILLYKMIFYIPPIFDSGGRNFLDKPIDFVSFSWHATKGSIFSNYLKKPRRAHTEFAKAGWFSKSYLEKKFSADVATRKLAVEALSRAAELPAGEVMELYSNGMGYFYIQQYNRAAAYFEKAIESKPDFADAYYRLGIIAEESNNLSHAISLYEKTVELLPNHIDSLLALERLSREQE